MGVWQHWLKALAGLVLVIAFFDLLLPENESKKLAKTIIGLVITAALLQPIVGIISAGWDGAVLFTGMEPAASIPDYDWLGTGQKVGLAGMEPVRTLIGTAAAAQLEALLITSGSIQNAKVEVTTADDGSVGQVRVIVWPVSGQLSPTEQESLKDWAVSVAARYLQIDPSSVTVEFGESRGDGICGSGCRHHSGNC